MELDDSRSLPAVIITPSVLLYSNQSSSLPSSLYILYIRVIRCSCIRLSLYSLHAAHLHQMSPDLPKHRILTSITFYNQKVSLIASNGPRAGRAHFTLLAYSIETWKLSSLISRLSSPSAPADRKIINGTEQASKGKELTP